MIFKPLGFVLIPTVFAGNFLLIRHETGKRVNHRKEARAPPAAAADTIYGGLSRFCFRKQYFYE
jgi:hypothetical protein